MHQQSILQQVTESFKKLGLLVTVPEEEPKVPFHGILVHFGTDEEERPLVLQVLQASQEAIITLTPEIHEKKELSELSILSFIMTIPIQVKAECQHETLSLIALTNKALPLGSFNYSNMEEVVYYSYNIPVFSEAPSENVLLALVNTLIFVKETFVSVIEDIASGKETIASFLEVLNEAESAGKRK